MIEMLRFKGSTGRIEYVKLDHTMKQFTTNYYRHHNIWQQCTEVRRKDVRAAIEKAREMGYTEY